MTARNLTGRSTPTIYDVAREAGVSIATVSRVLNAAQRVREPTRRKVMDAVERLGFVPRADASARARRDFKRIGVLTPFFTALSFVQRVRGVAATLAETDYELIIYTVDSQAKLRAYLDMLPISRRVDGLIAMSLPLDEASTRRLRDNGLETVCIEYDHSSFSCVQIDNAHGGALAARHLIARGYRRIAFVGETGEPSYALHPSDQRLEGFRRTLEEAGLALPEAYVVRQPYRMESVIKATLGLLDLPEPPEAVFATSDIQAVGVLKGARRRGLGVPQDLGVMGFDNLDLADYLELTTVNQSLDESGRTAVELLLARLTDPSRPLQNVRIQLAVVERATA
jgi:DNA-binding LacI/PurR family transcriptional regulator